MTPVYLKFADKKTADAALLSAWPKGDPSLDIVGAIPNVTGYHVNWIGESLPASLAAYVITPVTPSRVFAGWSPEEIAARAAK